MSSSEQIQQKIDNLNFSYKKYSQWKTDLESVLSSIERSLAQPAQDVNKKLQKSAKSIGSGLTGISDNDALYEGLLQMEEKNSTEDAQLSQMYASIRKEIKRCSEKMDKLNESIIRAKNDLSDAEIKEMGSFGGR